MKKAIFLFVFVLITTNGFAINITLTTDNLLGVKKKIASSILFVKPTGSGMQDGSSWENASSDIQAKINIASPNTQIWIAAGTYKPIRPANNLGVIELNNRDNAFVMKDNVSLYGGFSGVETSVDERDIIANPTVLSGDFNEDDVVAGIGKTLTISNSAENAHHVIINRGTVTIDGLKIAGGAANGGFTIQIGNSSINSAYGGGIFNINGTLTLSNVIFTANTATDLGAGIYTINGTLILNNCSVNQNLNIMKYGGGIYQQSGNISMHNCEVMGNYSRNMSGGGIYFYVGTVSINNSNISHNATNLTGGGIHNYLGTLNLLNSVISNNSANSSGGGIVSQQFVNTVTKITNCTISKNISQYVGGVVGNAQFRNSIVWSNISDYYETNGTNFQPTIMYHSIIEGLNIGGSGSGNIDGTNPSLLVFTDSQNNDFSLASGSSLIDAGSNTLYENEGGNLILDKDIAANPRLVNVNIDLGAYEFGGEMSVPDINKKEIIIYPNPVKDILSFSEEVSNIRITDISGRTVKEIFTKGKLVNVANLAKGSYIITAVGKSGERINRKFIKE